MSAGYTLGRWPIVLSGRARGELRLLAEDSSVFDTLRKKIRELSLGQLTSDNYTLVNGSLQYIPIYEAHIGDLRMIYLIDLESDGHNQYDHQIIRILSVSSGARVDYGFWVKVSRFMRQKGMEYRSNCIHRSIINHKHGPLYVPSSFLHKDYIPLAAPDPESGSETLLLDLEMNQLHQAVVLEKYTPVTKSLYNSILADMDAVLPIILSSDEKAIIRYQGTSVVIGRSGTGKTTALVYKMRAHAQAAEVSDNGEPIRQLFVTRSPVLTRRVASYYKGLTESSEIADKSPEELQRIRRLNQTYTPGNLLEFDNEADLRDDLPNRFSELTETHFPLFISFDKLGQLLEADALGTNDALELARVRLKRLVDFNAFKHQYWPKFDYNLTRTLDPALIYSEIMGVIKGGRDDLTETEYLSLSIKKSPLLASIRREVYTIFKAYRQRCASRGESDSADRVRKILSARADGINMGPGVGYLFVDEVQDQLMADIYLLHSLCSNINGGYWCGDTAQTINVGSSFRIRDLKAFLYDRMVPEIYDLHNGLHSKIVAPFETFELTVNFRSHRGIVKYAASLVQLLYTLFPGSIDHMQLESAPVPGPKPLIFVSPIWDEDLFAQCLLNQIPADQVLPFSPEQAIIVRSEETAHSLRVKLHNRCNVLTLLESKGLEFDDLIIYGFFAESDVPASLWRRIAILESYEEDGIIRFSQPSHIDSLSPLLCSELKQLYVAVTRARHRCWLWDSGPTVGMMKGFWQSLGLINVSPSIDRLSLFPGKLLEYQWKFIKWAQRGEGFFANGLYAVAKTCFERAGQEKEAQISDAYNHMSEAGKRQEDSPGAHSAYIKAAEKMKECTNLHSSHSPATLWYHAASCFEAAKEIPQASEAYSRGGFYDRAVLVFFEAGDMAGCLEVILEYSKQVDEALLRRIKEDASIYFLKQRDYWRLERLHDGDFGKCVELARKPGFRDQLKDLLKRAGRFEDLATEYLKDESPAEAVDCLVHLLGSASAFEWCRNIISTFFWTRFGLGSTPGTKARDQADSILKLCNSCNGLLDQEGLQDAKIFKPIIYQEQISSVTFYNLRESLSSESAAFIPRMVILGYHALRGNHWFPCLSYSDFCTFLKTWSTFSIIFQQLRSRAGELPSQDVGIRRLFGLFDSPNTDAPRVTIPHGSALHESIREVQGKNGTQRRTGVVVYSYEADTHIGRFLANQMKKELIGLSSNLLKSQWTQPMPVKTPGQCGVSPEHIAKSISLALSTLASAIDRERGSQGGTGASLVTDDQEETIRSAWSMRLFSLTISTSDWVDDLMKYVPGTNDRGPNASAHAWVVRNLQLLDPAEDRFATIFVVCVALSFELQPSGAQKVKKALHSLVSRGHSRQLGPFVDDILMFFQRKSEWRVIAIYRSLHHLVRNKSSIDISILVYVIEEATRGVIQTEHASSGGLSGLIAPRSWAMSLSKHSAHERAYALKSFSLGDFVNRVWVIIVRILNGIPEYWNLPDTRAGAPDLHRGLIALRLLWSIVFVMVNLRPDHESTRFVQDVLNHVIIKLSRHATAFATVFASVGFSISSLPSNADRKSILPVLHEIYPHEEVLMLQQRSSNVHPNVPLFGGRIIVFDSVVGLGNMLACDLQPRPENQAVGLKSRSVNIAASDESRDLGPNSNAITATASEPSGELHIGMSKVIPLIPVPPPRPDTPTSITDSDGAERLSLQDAALRVSSAWRRSIKRVEQRRQPSAFSPIGQLYNQYFRVGTKESVHDEFTLKLRRGPCINIIFGLRLLAKQLHAYIAILNSRLAALGQTPATEQDARALKGIKEWKWKAGGYKNRILLLTPLDSPPKLLIAKDLEEIGTQTKKAWDLFTDVKNSKICQGSTEFRRVEYLVSSGAEAVTSGIRIRDLSTLRKFVPV